MVVFPAQPPDLRRSPLVARVRGQLSASPGLRRLVSGFCSSARGFCSPLLSAPASRPDRSPGFFALRFARGRCDQLPPGFSPVHHLHAGHTTKPARRLLMGTKACAMMAPEATSRVVLTRVALTSASESVMSTVCGRGGAGQGRTGAKRALPRGAAGNGDDGSGAHEVSSFGRRGDRARGRA